MRQWIAILLVLFFALPAAAGGGGVTGGATEFTQIANNVQLGAILGKEVEQIVKQVLMIQNQIKQYQEMVRQGMALPQSLWRSVTHDLVQLKNSVQMTSGLYSSLGNMDKVFRQTNPGIVSRSDRGMTYEEWYKAQSEGYNNTIAATLKSISKSSEQMETDSELLKSLQAQSSSAVGQMQALQVGNDIAAVTVQQLMKLQFAIDRQTILLASHLSVEQENSDASAAEREQYLKDMEKLHERWNKK